MSSADLAQSIGRELPYLRRYARALTGSFFTWMLVLCAIAVAAASHASICSAAI